MVLLRLGWSPIGVLDWFLKFKGDGVARGKPSPAGIGGVHNSKGEILFMFLTKNPTRKFLLVWKW